MRAYIVGSSALYFWRRAQNVSDVLCNRNTHPLLDCPQSAHDLYSLKLPEDMFGNQPIHLMVPSAMQRFERNKYWYSVPSRQFPKSAFCNASPHFCIASPEMCLLESVKGLSEFQVMELCMELCGKYSLISESQRGFVSRNYAFTSVDAIRTFTCEMRGWPGTPALASLLKYVDNGSRSPMETRQYLLMCLPRKYGGYGIPRPLVNARVELSQSDKIRSGRSYLECDMHWPKAHVVVEYDGHDDHETREDRARDAVKRNILTAQGNTVFTVTGKQICDTMAFDSIVRDISHAIGYRLKGFPNDWEQRRIHLRNVLFKSMVAYERNRYF